MDQGQLRLETERGQQIVRVVQQYRPRNIVEIGTWKGLGSTLCILQGIQNYTSNFISLESNKEFYEIAKTNLKGYLNRVQLIYGKIVEEDDVNSFVKDKNIPTNELDWLKDDLRCFSECPNVLDKLPDQIDFLLLDGGEFSTYTEWQKLKDRTKIVAMDDVTRLKCEQIKKELDNDPRWVQIESSHEGAGFCIYNRLNNLDFIEINKLSGLHNGKTIIFCKTDFLHNEFEYIRTLPNKVILISGNSDYPILDHDTLVNKFDQPNNVWSHNLHLPPWKFFQKIPNNIEKWYAENLLCYHPKVEPLPLGLECTYDSNRKGHGGGYFERGSLKERLLRRNSPNNPQKFIYANFTLNWHREHFKQVIDTVDYIDWDIPNLSIEKFFDKILEYKMVLCPMGNGVDTHRLWEVLYAGRIPITGKVADFKIYDLYKQLPIIILDNISQLKDYDYLKEKYEETINKRYNTRILDINWWKQKIIREASKL